MIKGFLKVYICYFLTTAQYQLYFHSTVKKISNKLRNF